MWIPFCKQAKSEIQKNEQNIEHLGIETIHSHQRSRNVSSVPGTMLKVKDLRIGQTYFSEPQFSLPNDGDDSAYS